MNYIVLFEGYFQLKTIFYSQSNLKFSSMTLYVINSRNSFPSKDLNQTGIINEETKADTSKHHVRSSRALLTVVANMSYNDGLSRTLGSPWLKSDFRVAAWDTQNLSLCLL